MGPIVVAVVGTALLVAGFVSTAGDGKPTLSAALARSGALDRPQLETPVVVTPADAAVGRTATHDPPPTSTPPATTPSAATTTTTTTTTTIAGPVWENWPVVLSSTFEDDVRWEHSVVGNTTRNLLGPAYIVSLSTDIENVFGSTWQYDYQPGTDFRIAVDIVSSAGRGQCGLAFGGGEGIPSTYFVVDSSSGNYRVNHFPPTGPPDVLADGERRIAIETDGVNHLALLREGNTVTVFSNDTPLATVTEPAFEVPFVGLAIFAPRNHETATCEYDNFEVRSP